MAKFIDLDTGLPALLNKVKAWVNSKTEDFITAEDAAGIVAATGDLVIVERDNYIDILITESQVNITPASLALYAAQKSAVIKVSGTHLKNDISISVPTGFTATPSTIAQVGGTVAQTDVTIAYTGADASTASGNITATAGDVVKSIPVAYSQYAGPTILADNTLTIKAAAGQSNTGSLHVTGLNLTVGINATVSGTGFTVSNTENGTYGNQASLPSSGGTLYVKFSPTGSSASTGTLTLESTGATSIQVALTGKVSELTVSKQSISISTDQGVAAMDKFTIQGTNLTNGVTLALTDANSVFSLSKNSLTKAEAEAGETITVTYNSSAAGNHSGSIAVNWDGTTQTVSLSGTAAAATMSDAEGKFTKEINGKTIYFKRLKVNDEFTNNVGVYNSNYNTSAASSTLYSGAISIPATVACDGTTYNVTTIAGYAFGSCTGLTSLTIAEGITTISANAIRGCTNNSFTSLTIPNSVTSLGQNNLFQCSKLTNIVIGDGVTAIGQYFDTLGTISNITIGSSVASIGKYSTIKMSDSGTVTIKRTTPPSIEGVVFKTSAGSYPCNATLKVPSEAVNTYKTRPTWGENGSGASNWHQFNPDNIVAIDE